MLEAFNWIVNLFLNTPVQIIVLVLGSAGVSILSQVLKKWFKIENEKWVFLLVAGIAAAGSGLDWFIHSNSLPPMIIGLQTSVLIGIAQPIYFYVIKPLSLIVSSYKASRRAIEDKLEQLDPTATPIAPVTTQPLPEVATQPVATLEPSVSFVETPVSRPVATF